MKKYTDQEFLYRQTPVNYDGIAKFTSIKGNTLGWNQLNQNGNYASTSGLSTWGCTVSVSNNVLTFKATANSGNYAHPYIDLVNGHKYLIAVTIQKDNANEEIRYGFEYGYNKTYAADNVTTKKTYHHIINSTYTGQAKLYLASYGSTFGNVFVSNYMCFDLTQMGLDSLTVDEFTSLFPLPYYDYNQGTLIPFSGNGIKTVGKNLLSYSGENLPYNANGVSITREDNIYKVVASNPSGYPFARISTIHYLPKGQYTVTMFGAETSNTGIAWRLIDRNVSPVNVLVNASATNTTFTLNEDAHDVYFEITIDASKFTTGTWDVRFQLNIGTPSDYEPYTETTTSLPISTYFPTGMKSAGNVYDELTPNKAITRVGAVDLGTLTWVLGGGGNFYDTPVIDDLVPSSINIKSSRYTTGYSSAFENDSSLIGFSIAASKKIRFYNSGLSSAGEVASALSGVYLYYELATETETDAEDIFYKFYGNGTEQILPVNGSAPTTAPIIADIEYYNQIESETPYRKFWFVNGNGDRWNLTEKELKSFLDSPQGLGFQKSIDVTRYGEMAYKNKETYNFPQVSGDILFYDSVNATRYEKYNEFVRFLMVQPLTLYYQMPVSIYSGIADIYTLDCEVINLTKTESKTDRMLTCPIQISGLEFFNGEEVEIQGTGGTFTIENNSDFAVGFEITIEGGVLTNPYFTLSQDGEIYGEAKFFDSTYFSSVYVNSNDGEQDAILMRGSSVLPNPLSYQDLSIANGSIYVTFVKLARGVSELTVGAETGTIRNVNIKFTPKYRSV